MNDKGWTPFITHYLRVNRWKVLQVEVHPLSIEEDSPDGCRTGCMKKPRGHKWFADRHLQEILQLLKETIYTRVSLTSKDIISSRPDVITGQSVRLGYAFKKRLHHQFYLTLHNTQQFEKEDENSTMTGQYCPYHIHREKMVVYVMPVGESGKTGMSKLLHTLNCGQPSVDNSSYFVKSPRKSCQPSVDNSSYFVKSPRKSGTSGGETDTGSHHSQTLPQESSSSKDRLVLPEEEHILYSRDGVTVPCILIEEGNNENVMLTNNSDKKIIPEQDIKEMLKKCASKLSKQFKRKGKSKRGSHLKRLKLIDPVAEESLPDLNESLKDDSDQNTITSDVEEESLRTKQEKRHLIEKDDDHNSEPKAASEGSDVVNFSSDIESLESEMHEEVFESINATNLNSEVVQLDLKVGSKPKKSLKIQKGKSFKTLERIAMSTHLNLSPIKDCSILLEKLSEEDLLGKEISPRKTVPKMSPILAFLRGPLASSSGIRLSERMSEMYSQGDETSEVIDVDEETGQVDFILNNYRSPTEPIKDEETEAMWTAIRSMSEVSDLSEEQLTFLVQENKLYLRNIFQGTSYCGRHQDYKAGGKSRSDLVYQLHFGAFSDEQSDLVMDTLMSIFCQNHKKYLDYLMKVLLPEMFVKIYMEVFQINYQQAVHKIQDYIGSLEMTID